MTVHKLSAGDGYTYLTRQVACGDERRATGQSLTEYYVARGNPPGVWAGRGAEQLGVAGTEVTEAQMKALFGEGRHPDGVQKLGAAYPVYANLDQPLDQRTRAALASTLPRIGRDAARTVELLAARGDLLTLQPIPLQTRKAWRPITPEQGQVLVARFTHAADASARAAAAIQDLHRPSARAHEPRSHEPRERQLARLANAERGVAQ